MRTSVDLHNFLQSRDVPHEISLIEIPAKTTEMAAASLGLDQSEIGKSLLVEVDEKPIIVMIPGNKRLDMRKLKKITGTSKIKFVDPEEIVSITGYVPGTIPPAGHVQEIPVYIDLRLLYVPIIYTSGGQTNTVLKIKPLDLVAAVDAKVVDVADDGRN